MMATIAAMANDRRNLSVRMTCPFTMKTYGKRSGISRKDRKESAYIVFGEVQFYIAEVKLCTVERWC